MRQKITYLDNASTTRLDERVLSAMEPYFFNTYAVATSEMGYSMGIDARQALDGAREYLASVLGAGPHEFVFTSGATESTNTALKGAAKSLRKKKGNHIIISRIEDFPVITTARALERDGFEVTYLDVDKKGNVNLDQLEGAISSKTILASIQHANQEIGTIQDIKTISGICKHKGVLFHTDATHSFRRVPLNVNEVPVDLITLSAHTIHGPRGIGGLYIRKNTPFTRWMDGGFQEFGLRAGVENIPGAVGFARAAQLITDEENRHIKNLRDVLIDRLLKEVPHTILNGPLSNRLPQNANITFYMVEGESITLHLDMRGIAVSTGSACFSQSLEASHVITGIGGDHERAHGSVRFSLGRFNTLDEVNKAVDAVSEIVPRLREISPLKMVASYQ
ncbi:MAG: cysteine desulfurase family protein [Spirochaetota bacterium]